MATDDQGVTPRRRPGFLRRGAQRFRSALWGTKPLACQEMVELVTAYLDGALEPTMQSRFEAHLRDCDGCATYLADLRVTVATLGGITDEQLDPVFRSRLMAALAGTTGSW